MIAMCAFAGPNRYLIVLSLFALGFLVSGANIGAYALVSSYYATENRSTGVSWANAVGRVGAALGSMAGGWMMAAGLKLQGIMLTLTIPAAVATGCLVLLGTIRSARMRESAEMTNAVPVGGDGTP
jgi:MFS transporter, AAHS family, 4-hydroxybenzoate transporter